MKKNLRPISILLGWMLIFPLLAMSQRVSISLPDTAITAQDQIIVPMTISDVTGRGLNSFEFTIVYDSTIVAIDSVLTEGFMADGYLIIPNNPQGDRIVVAAAGVDELTGAGTLLALRVKLLQDGASDLLIQQIKLEPEEPQLRLRNGRIQYVSVASRDEFELPTSYITVSQNFPNPFRKTTRFALDLAGPAQIGIELYSMTGRRVLAYPPRSYLAGPEQYLTLESDRLPAGSYLYRITSSAQGGIFHKTGILTIIR